MHMSSGEGVHEGSKVVDNAAMSENKALTSAKSDCSS